MRLDLPIIIQTILLDPSGAIWTDGASNVTRLDLSGAVWFDRRIRLVVEARSARRSVRGGQNLSARRVGLPQNLTGRHPVRDPRTSYLSCYARFGVARSPSVVEDGCCGGGFGGPCGRAPGLVGTRGPASSQPGGLPGSVWEDTLCGRPRSSPVPGWRPSNIRWKPADDASPCSPSTSAPAPYQRPGDSPCQGEASSVMQASTDEPLQVVGLFQS